MPDDAALDFNDDELLPVVAQDAATDEVLMVAYANPAAVTRTHETGLAHYYSRSRSELWQKGETSGHHQHVEEIRVDCDADTLLYRVSQTGGACHTGYRSCFHRRLTALSTTDDTLSIETETIGERVFDPTEVYE